MTTASLKPRVHVLHERVLTTSLAVAEHFDKLHKDVLKAIDNTLRDCPDDFTERNFALSDYKDLSGRSLPMYRMTRDGFSLIAMGFTGTAAVRWKIAYLTAFNAMENSLRTHETTLSSPDVPPPDGSFTCDGTFYLRLLHVLHHDTSAAHLLWYLIDQGAHRCAIPTSSRALGEAISLGHSTVQRATAELERRGLLYLDTESYALHYACYRYRVLADPVHELLAEHEQRFGSHLALPRTPSDMAPSPARLQPVKQSSR